MTEPPRRCFHCGEPAPSGAGSVVIDGHAQPVCCAGCAAAAEFIRGSGLDDYYRLRSAPGGRARNDDYRAFDRDDLLLQHSRWVDAEQREVTLISDGMRCAACAWLIDRALSREPAITRVQANAVTGRIHIRWQPALQPLSQLLQRLAGLGYPVFLSPGLEHEAARLRERRWTLLRLGVAVLGSLQAMMLAEALYLDFDRTMAIPTRDFFRWVTLLVSTPVVFFSGWPFLAGMARELRAGRPAMDALVGLSILLAWGASAVETWRGGPHVWFDAAVMFVLFLLAARSLEGLARQRAGAVIERLARARPALATRIDPGGLREQVALTDLAVGDRVEVAAGERVPADGRLFNDGEFDESQLNGESEPRLRRAGSTVLAGSQCLATPVQLQVERVGADTWLSALVRSIEAAQAARPALVEHSDRLARQLVAGLLLAALVSAALWLQIDPARAFEVTLAVLVVSCPCALALAVPAALASAHAGLARLGLLALRADALPRLAAVDHLLFDKTGTLSAGTPVIQRIEVFNGDQGAARDRAAALEIASGHPLAAAFADPGRLGLAVAAVEVHPGQGVSGIIDGREHRIGRADFTHAGNDDGGIWLAADGLPLARFELHDPPRSGADAAVRALATLAIDSELCSGDAESRVAAMAHHCGIRRYASRCSPQQKIDLLRQRQAAGRTVAMVGDGINDAPVLAAADVSIALASGAALAHHAADLVLLNGQLPRLAEGVRLARRFQRVLRQNLGWALAYNLLALPIAMSGLVQPWQAALGMTLSSLLVTANALRLQRLPAPIRRSQPDGAGLPRVAEPVRVTALPNAPLVRR